MFAVVPLSNAEAPLELITMIKPCPFGNKCCDVGTFEHQVPMPIKGRIQYIDYCVADIVAALNAANITTICSCCGHGTTDPIIMLEDNRVIYMIIDKDKKV